MGFDMWVYRQRGLDRLNEFLNRMSLEAKAQNAVGTIHGIRALSTEELQKIIDDAKKHDTEKTDAK